MSERRSTSSRTHASARRTRHRWPWLVLGCLPLLAGCEAVRGWISGGPPEEAGTEAPERVRVLVVSPTPFADEIETTGTVTAPNDVTLAAGAAGTLQRLVPEGQRVPAGTIVARIDPGAAAAAVAEAAAALETAQAQLAEAEDAYQRQAPLVADSVISALELEGIQSRRAQARAGVQQARAGLQQARERLDQYLLRAPVAGTVEAHLASVGEQVSPGEAVIRVVSGGRVEVTAGIPEAYVGDIQLGAPVTVTFNAYGIPARTARVSFVGQTIDPRSRTFPIRVDLPDPRRALKAEMIAQLSVLRRRLPQAIVVPLVAVLRDERGASVYVVEGGAPAAARDSGLAAGVVRRRDVTLGPRSARGVVVERGLDAGEEVVVLGLDAVAPGDTVHVAERYRSVAAAAAALADSATLVPGR